MAKLCKYCSKLCKNMPNYAKMLKTIQFLSHTHSLILCFEFEGDAVYAVAFAGGWRAVGEYVAQVAFASCAQNFYPVYCKRIIRTLFNIFGVNGVKIAWLTYVIISWDRRPSAK